ncbi:MAG TPA: glycoside hydrolase family 43 protein [Chitinispirillaceae bacterium]|nr:glycoside hydrolase family 43 protein [Chitinispirillaceae bacterium]
MKNSTVKIVITSLLFCFTGSFADNPIIQNFYSADPAPMVYKDRVYLYTSHDDDKTESDFYTMRNYLCYSSADMVNWTDHGIVATLKEFSWLNGHNNDAWAPQCVERNGKFYLYIPIHGKGIGVMEADSPLGPFKDPIKKALINRGNWSDIDPTVYVDSDDQAYMFWGNGDLWYVKLNENMTSYSGSIVTTNPKPNNYTEGPWFYKRNNQYYMIYAGMGGGNENIAYSMSNSATGPWTYKGVIMASGNCFTNHPGICDFKGNTYFFYHNSNLPGGGTFKRSVCVEKFSYKDDGTIPSISMTKNGPDQVDSLNPYDTVQAETVCWGQGIETETCSEGGMQVTSIDNGDYIKVKGVGFGTGANIFKARVASNSNGGQIELHLDSQTGKTIGTCTVTGTGGLQNWVTDSCTIDDNVNGKHDLFIVFKGSSSSMFNFNWWKFEELPVTGAVNLSVQHKSNNLKLLSKDAAILRFTYNVPEDYSGKNFKITFSDLQGRLAASQICAKQASGMIAFSMDRKLLRSGMYVIRISNDNKVLFNNCYLLN